MKFILRFLCCCFFKFLILMFVQIEITFSFSTLTSFLEPLSFYFVPVFILLPFCPSVSLSLSLLFSPYISLSLSIFDYLSLSLILLIYFCVFLSHSPYLFLLALSASSPLILSSPASFLVLPISSFSSPFPSFFFLPSALTCPTTTCSFLFLFFLFLLPLLLLIVLPPPPLFNSFLLSLHHFFFLSLLNFPSHLFSISLSFSCFSLLLHHCTR